MEIFLIQYNNDVGFLNPCGKRIARGGLGSVGLAWSMYRVEESGLLIGLARFMSRLMTLPFVCPLFFLYGILFGCRVKGFDALVGSL